MGARRDHVVTYFPQFLDVFHTVFPMSVAAYLAGLTYVWSLVDERHKNKMQKHEAKAPKSPVCEGPTVVVDKEHEEQR